MKKIFFILFAVLSFSFVVRAGLFDDLVNTAVQEAGKAVQESAKEAVKESVKESVEEAVYGEEETSDAEQGESSEDKSAKKTYKNQSKSLTDPKKDVVDINETGFKSANEFVKKVADKTKDMKWMNIEFAGGNISNDKGSVSVNAQFSKDKEDFFANTYAFNPGNMLQYKIAKKEGKIISCFAQYPIVLMVMSIQDEKKDYDRVEKAIKEVLPKCEPCSNYSNSVFGE